MIVLLQLTAAIRICQITQKCLTPQPTMVVYQSTPGAVVWHHNTIRSCPCYYIYTKYLLKVTKTKPKNRILNNDNPSLVNLIAHDSFSPSSFLALSILSYYCCFCCSRSSIKGICLHCCHHHCCHFCHHHDLSASIVD
jgi:hypothetical protein